MSQCRGVYTANNTGDLFTARTLDSQLETVFMGVTTASGLYTPAFREARLESLPGHPKPQFRGSLKGAIEAHPKIVLLTLTEAELKPRDSIDYGAVFGYNDMSSWFI